MSERMEMVEKSSVYVHKSENEIMSKLSRDLILKILNTYTYNENALREIFIGDNYTATVQNDLNVIFRRMSNEHNILILDILLVLDEIIHKEKKIVSFLDNETKSMLKIELSRTHNIRLRENELSNFLTF